MNSATFNDGGTQYVRVSKTIARKAYDDGKPVVLCPVKLRPFGGFRPSVMIDKVGWSDRSFADVVSDFEGYNCQDNETGGYAAYYVQVMPVPVCVLTPMRMEVPASRNGKPGYRWIQGYLVDNTYPPVPRNEAYALARSRHGKNVKIEVAK